MSASSNENKATLEIFGMIERYGADEKTTCDYINNIEKSISKLIDEFQVGKINEELKKEIVVKISFYIFNNYLNRINNKQVSIALLDDFVKYLNSLKKGILAS
jgi:hypothetical protein